MDEFEDRTRHQLDVAASDRSGQHQPELRNRSRLRHELYIDTGDADANSAALAHFGAHRVAMQAAYGQNLQFEELPGKRACRIADYRADADVADTHRHDEFIDWLIDAGVRLRAALREVPPVPSRRAASDEADLISDE